MFSLLILIYLPISLTFAQNISAIEQWVKSAPDEYSILLDRFEKGEKDISMSDLEKLYYGFAYCKEYNGNFDLFTEMYDALKGRDRDKALEEAIKCKKLNPVCLEVLYPIAFLTNKTIEGADNEYRLISMIKVIMNSGDGKSPQSAYKVIRTGDEYKFLSIVYQMDALIMQSALDCDIDQMDIRTHGGKEITVYFDRSLPTARDAEVLNNYMK